MLLKRNCSFVPNIEIKAVYKDLEKGRDIARGLCAHSIGIDHQTDTYFKTPQGRMKLRESSLSGAYLIPYLRPDQKEAKKMFLVLSQTKKMKIAKQELFLMVRGYLKLKNQKEKKAQELL